MLDIPILLYHKVNDFKDESPLRVSGKHFLEHMDYLKTHGFQVVSLDDIVSYKKGSIKLPQKSIAITFDDGYEDNYTHAFPILKKYDFRATIFLVAHLIGKTNQWDAIKSMPSAMLMNENQILEMSAAGISFGSHGLDHRRLNRLKTLPYLWQEIKNSRQKIESILKKPVVFFCYPYGKFNKLAKFLVKACGYQGACALKDKKTTRTQLNSDIYALHRIEIHSRNSSLDLFTKLIEDTLRPKLNILQVCTKATLGGMESYAVTLAAKLKERGHRVIFALRKDSPLEIKAKQNGLVIEYLKIMGSIDLKSIRILVQLIKNHAIDIVHVHASRDYYSAILAAKLTRRKIVVTRHLLSSLHSLTLRMLKRADALIGVSQAAKNSLTQSGMISSHQVEVLYNGINMKIFHPREKCVELRKTFGFKEDDFIIGNIGRMGDKGQEELVYALQGICEKYPQTKCLFISQLSSVPNLEGLAAKLGIRDHFVFHGYREDIPEILAMIDLFVIAPRVESLSLVLIEAMACKKPVIGTRVGGIPELIQDKVNGLLVPPQDVQALSGAIEWIISHPDETSKMVLRAYKIVKEKFDLEHAIDQTEAVYEQIL